jgi:hypothetical protein
MKVFTNISHALGKMWQMNVSTYSPACRAPTQTIHSGTYIQIDICISCMLTLLWRPLSVPVFLIHFLSLCVPFSFFVSVYLSLHPHTNHCAFSAPSSPSTSHFSALPSGATKSLSDPRLFCSSLCPSPSCVPSATSSPF